MNVLSDAARALLAEVRPRQPFFSNQVLAELFDQHHTRGPYKLLPFAEGGYLVFDTRAENGRGALEHHGSVDAAHAALVRIAGGEPASS